MLPVVRLGAGPLALMRPAARERGVGLTRPKVAKKGLYKKNSAQRGGRNGKQTGVESCNSRASRRRIYKKNATTKHGAFGFCICWAGTARGPK